MDNATPIVVREYDQLNYDLKLSALDRKIDAVSLFLDHESDACHSGMILKL